MAADLQQGLDGLVKRISLQPLDAGVAHAACCAQSTQQRRDRFQRAAAGRETRVAGRAGCLEARCAMDARRRGNGSAAQRQGRCYGLRLPLRMSKEGKPKSQALTNLRCCTQGHSGGSQRCSLMRCAGNRPCLQHAVESKSPRGTSAALEQCHLQIEPAATESGCNGALAGVLELLLSLGGAHGSLCRLFRRVYPRPEAPQDTPQVRNLLVRHPASVTCTTCPCSAAFA